MNQRSTYLIIVGFVAILVVILTWNSITYTIESGEKAIIFRKFQGGLDKESVYGQGFHIKWPWDDIYTYDVRKREARSAMDVLDRNGLTITLAFLPLLSQAGSYWLFT